MDLLAVLLSLSPKALERRYREREAFCETARPPVAVRLDGVGFGKRLRDFPGPRSALVHSALVETARSLASTHGADYAHVVSDEINLLFLESVPYGGRTFKLITVLASHAAAEMTARLARPLHFDARAVKLEDRCDAARYVLYRARVGLNNYVIQLAKARGIVKEHTPHLADLLKEVEVGDYQLAWGTLLPKAKAYEPAGPEDVAAMCPNRTA